MKKATSRFQNEAFFGVVKGIACVLIFLCHYRQSLAIKGVRLRSYSLSHVAERSYLKTFKVPTLKHMFYSRCVRPACAQGIEKIHFIPEGVSPL